MNTRRIANIEYRRIVALEKKYTSVIRKALKEQMFQYADTTVLGFQMLESLRNMYEVELNYWLEREYKRLSKDVSKAKDSFFLHTWLDWISEELKILIADKIVNINKTTKGLIKSIIEDGYNRGLTRGEIAKEIKNRATGIETFKRARTIARTELGNAVNLAKSKSVLDFEKETGVEMGKKWIHRGAKDPRDEHILLDNGRVYPKSTPFVAYGEEIQYPHESGASARNVINCNCQVVYKRLKR